MSAMPFSIVIPVHNEAASIGAVLDAIAATLGAADYETVVVDDGSSDATLALLRRRRQSDRRLTLVINPRNLGQSTALLFGVRAARGDWIVTFDGDGQNDPADIPRLLACAAAHPGVAMVAGQRGDQWGQPLERALSRGVNRLRRALLGDGLRDGGCSLKLIRRDIYLELPYFDHMHRFMPALVRRHGGSVATLAVGHRPRGAGRSHYGLLDRLWAGAWDLLGMLWLLRRNRLPPTAAVVEREPPQLPPPPGPG